jgi:hypothetical protein
VVEPFRLDAAQYTLYGEELMKYSKRRRDDATARGCACPRLRQGSCRSGGCG